MKGETTFEAEPVLIGAAVAGPATLTAVMPTASKSVAANFFIEVLLGVITYQVGHLNHSDQIRRGKCFFPACSYPRENYDQVLRRSVTLDL